MKAANANMLNKPIKKAGSVLSETLVEVFEMLKKLLCIKENPSHVVFYCHPPTND